MDWKEFFKNVEDYRIRVVFYSCEQSFTVEELYQQFKNRIMAEERIVYAADEEESDGT